MKLSRADIHTATRKIPRLSFGPQRRLTAYAGLVVFQALFQRLRLLRALRQRCGHVGQSAIFGLPHLVLLLIVHLLLGFRRLRDLDYCREDPLVRHVVGLRKLPDVGTLSRGLKDCDRKVVDNLRELNRRLVTNRLQQSGLHTITIDFDGSVQSTQGHAEGTAVGFNKKKKGARSYYPLFSTIAQLHAFFDLHHRPGNVHDSNGAYSFIAACLFRAHLASPQARLESRVDGAFYSEKILQLLDACSVEFTCSVPFERLLQLRTRIERRQRWSRIDDTWSFFEADWAPKCWSNRFRLLCLRQRRSVALKGPMQLDLFEPRDHTYEYKAIVTNKTTAARTVLLFHNGRGSQEKIFGEAKQHVALDYVPCRRLAANQVFTISAMIAHNLSRELQMSARPASLPNRPKRPPLWTFQSLGTIRQRLLHRAGSLTRPQGELTLNLNANNAVRDEMLTYLASSHVKT